MSRLRNIIGAAAAVVVAAYAARLTAGIVVDWQRMNRIRAMSDEGPFSEALPDLAARTVREERAAASEFASFFTKSPLELARYLKAESM